MDLKEMGLILREIPLFSGLSEEELEFIKERSSIKEYKKGDIIYEEGSAPSSFYCIIVGRVVIFTKGASGDKIILEYLHRGKYFGIISLLTNEPHSVTSGAMNDCLILEIKEEDFDFIIKKVPSIAVDLSRTLSRRLKRKDTHRKTIFESSIVSVFSSYSQAGKTVYALNLSLSLAKETRKSVIILDILPVGKSHSLPARLGMGEVKIFDLSGAEGNNLALLKEFISKSEFEIDLACFYYQPEDKSSSKKILGILSLLVNDYNYLILDLPSLMDSTIFSVLNQSDLIHMLTSPDEIDLTRTRDLANRLKEELGFPVDKVKVVINEYKLAKIEFVEQFQILGQEIFATLPKIGFSPTDRVILDNPELEYSKAIRRIARVLGDRLVGLVLGVGVGYGFCHIGVLKVFEDENIPIDIIAGSSIGALIASLWATGKSAGEILQITKEFREPKHIWGLIDFTFPLLGFIKGNKLHKFLKKHLGNKTFYDVRFPLKIIASDVKRKEPKILDTGLLADAIMASCSMPGVFAPFRFKEDMLFDGGVTHPLPTEPLYRLGVNKIIAVNVTPSREDIIRQYEKLKQDITVKVPQDLRNRRWISLKERLRNIFKLNIVDIIFSSVEILQSEVAQKEALLADIVLHPDTSGLFWLEFHRAEEFAIRGEMEARKNLDKIKQLING